MKLTKKDKIKIIKLLNEGYGVSYLSKKFKISTSTVGTIRSLYRIHGYDFLNKTKKNNYSFNFKISIIKLIKSGSAIYDIATKYNINTGVIFSWLKKYSNLDYNGLERKIGRPHKMNLNKKEEDKEKITTDSEKIIKELKERNAQLEMENYLLKKLRALVQQRKGQQKKKK